MGLEGFGEDTTAAEVVEPVEDPDDESEDEPEEDPWDSPVTPEFVSKAGLAGRYLSGDGGPWKLPDLQALLTLVQ